MAETEKKETKTLTRYQLEMIEKNRQKAIKLRQSKIVSHPYAKTDVASIDKKTIKIGSSKFKDTGGGFLLEEGLELEEEIKILEQEPLLAESERPNCEKCENPIAVSWLLDKFDIPICDACKDPEEHKLITKSEAMKEYLLKDCDLDKRDPPLKFITKKNPHNSHWGDMKLYLHIQVEKRALEVWGSEEKIQEELEKREEKRVMSKAKRYQKKMRELRMNMRSSLYDKTIAASHTHEYGPDTYNEEDDTYTHTCTTCGFEETFEKM